MSTCSGGSGGSSGSTHERVEESVTTVYNGDRTAVPSNQRVSPLSSSFGDSGLDNSNTESSAGDAKLIIDVPDFSKKMETPRTGIDNPSFETDKTDVPKSLTNGHNGTVNQENGRHEKDKMAEAVNLELINMKPFANGKENGVPTKKKETTVNMNDTYDDYFIPVNEHKKYIRGGEKLYVTKDKRDVNQSKKPFICWVFGLVLLAAAVVIAILASTGVIFNNETAVESRNFENEKVAGFGGNLNIVQYSSVSPPPSVDNSSPFSLPTTDMSEVYVPRTVQGEVVIDNLQFTPGMADKSSSEFKSLARSIESELKKALFEEQTLNGRSRYSSDAIHVKVVEFASGSVVSKYRIGWEYKDANEPQDLIDVDTLISRLDTYIRKNNGFVYNYRIPIHRLRSDPVVDKCKTNNGNCSHYCSYDYTSLDFVCSCPSELILSQNMKDCQRRISSNNDEVDDFAFSNNNNEYKPESEPKVKSVSDESSPELEIQTESVANSEPEHSSEPTPHSEPEPNSEPEAKVESESSSEPEAKVEPEPSSEPEAKVEPEPSSEPEVKVEPEPSSEPETKVEPEPSSEPEAKVEPEPSSEPEAKVEPEPSSEPEAKVEPEPSSEPEAKVEPEPSSEPEAKVEPEPSSEPEAKVEPEPSSEPEVKVEPETSSEPEPSSELESKVEPEPSLEPEAKVVPEPSSEPESKSEPEPSSEPEAKSEPEPSSVLQIKTGSEHDSVVEDKIVVPEPRPEPEVSPELEPSSGPETKPNSDLEVKPVLEPRPEPEVTPEPESKVEPEPASNIIPDLSLVYESKIEPESSPEPENKTETDVHITPETKTKIETSSEHELKLDSESSTELELKSQPEASLKFESEHNVNLNPVSSSTESYESLSDVDISSDSEEQNVKLSSSTDKSVLNKEQSDREAKSHSDEVFSHEIKPEVTYATESEFETKTEMVSEESTKSKENNALSLVDMVSNGPEEYTTLPTITENWLTTTLSSVRSIPKLPSDLEENYNNNSGMEEEMKTESYAPSSIEQIELKSENKSTDLISDAHSNNSSEPATEWPEKSTSENLKDISSIENASSISESSTSNEDINFTSKDFENISKEPIIELVESTTIMHSTIEQESTKELPSSVDLNSSDTKHSDDLSSLEKSNMPDPSKKLQSLTSMEEQITNLPHSDIISTSTASNLDNFNENISANEKDLLDQIITQVSNQNIADDVNENEKSSALDLYQIKKKDKKTNKNPDFYLSDGGFTKRNKTKIEKEKENKKTNKSDLTDEMPDLSNLSKCEEKQFQCVNGTTKDGSYCIHISSRCDTNKDCSDNSDESDCSENECFENFQCKSGECLQRNLVCNNINDCADGSDEQSCDVWKCGDGEKQCAGGQCLPDSYFCDGKSDCKDHSDELQCNNTCNDYQCSNGYCISSNLRCNNVNDCPGGEDEQNCECNANEFKCNTGSECIPQTQVCDNVAQCTDRSDEWKCIQLDGTQFLAKKEGETAMKVCNTNWSDEWSNFVCQSLGFTEVKMTSFKPSEPNDNATSYLKLKDDSNLNNLKSLTGFFEPTKTPCETIEIKCSSKHFCGDFGGKDPFSMEMWPSVVYLQNTKTHQSCTSSLVKRNWLLSSYSCVHGIDESLSSDQWEAVSSKSRVANESNLTRIMVSRFISHPGVKYEKLRYFNDTVLVELSSSFNLSDEVNTICLPEKDFDDKQPCVTASWSYESPGVFKQFSRYLSDPLMQKDVCNSTNNFNGYLTEQEICVASGEMEANNMEIGSPLMCLAENGLWQLQGMLSYRGGYGRSSKPSLYNAIVDSVPWAENTITSGV